MPLIARDVKRSPDFHTWNLSDQLEVYPSAWIWPPLQTKYDPGNTLKPSISQTVNPPDQNPTIQIPFSIQSGDRIPIENRRS